ncbi:MAG: YggS family pyridoxal phosphate-dependent enzyme [Candidatus Omnitrophota bacterium]|jgi:hypothetical protein
MIAENLKSVTQRITRCCEKSGRPANEITLICVTKEATIEDASEAVRLGAVNLGENRVQELVSKHKAIGDKALWHLIGHLQTNKVRDAVGIASLIHSVDSDRLAKEIDKEAAKLGKVQDILIQVNVSGEASKFGIAPEHLSQLLKEVSLYRNIAVKGLMTIAPEAEDIEKVRPFFHKLRELKDRAGLQLLSMGMTNDFEIAIEEGSDIVRIGRAIFGWDRS